MGKDHTTSWETSSATGEEATAKRRARANPASRARGASAGTTASQLPQPGSYVCGPEPIATFTFVKGLSDDPDRLLGDFGFSGSPSLIASPVVAQGPEPPDRADVAARPDVGVGSGRAGASRPRPRPARTPSDLQTPTPRAASRGRRRKKSQAESKGPPS